MNGMKNLVPNVKTMITIELTEQEAEFITCYLEEEVLSDPISKFSRIIMNRILDKLSNATIAG